MYEELKKWKRLLDEGVITQEEFDEKKGEILGLGTRSDLEKKGVSPDAQLCSDSRSNDDAQGDMPAQESLDAETNDMVGESKQNDEAGRGPLTSDVDGGLLQLEKTAGDKPAEGCEAADASDCPDKRHDRRHGKARKQEKKRWLVVTAAIGVVVVLGLLIGTHVICFHDWASATCSQPKTCYKCGKTEGEPNPLNHGWNVANCTQPKHCVHCGLTEGEINPKNHCWEGATCTEPKTCDWCGKTIGKPLGHKWSKGTCEEPATCSRCGEVDEASGHKLGKATLGDIDFVEATAVEKQKCTKCGETIESKDKKINSFVTKDKKFLFSPDDFLSVFEDRIDNIEGCDDFSIVNDSDSSMIAYRVYDGDVQAGMITFYLNGKAVGSGSESKGQKAYQVLVICPKSASNSKQNVARILAALITSCDPKMSISSSKPVGKKVIANEDASKNGVRYTFYPKGEYYWLEARVA